MGEGRGGASSEKPVFSARHLTSPHRHLWHLASSPSPHNTSGQDGSKIRHLRAPQSGQAETATGTPVRADIPRVAGLIAQLRTSITWPYNTMACPHCYNLQPPALSDIGANEKANFSVHFDDLQQSADRGCMECTLLHDAVKTVKTEWSARDREFPVEVRADTSSPLEISHIRGLVSLELFHKSSGPERGHCPETVGTTTLVSQHSSSSDCTALLARWLQECNSGHEHCADLDQNRPLPTRVLDISNDQKHVFLYETLERRGRYVALSYCWGSPAEHRALKTTRSTLENHKAGILIENLPKTIRHAVTIARDQGFRYLWVDALCIVQDDEADWASEAARMCDVYSNATLTIVASRASGSSNGIFGHQDYSDSARIPYKDTFLQVRTSLKVDHESIRGLDREPWPTEPITMRAWTVQENLLSNRTVEFTTKELRWRCNTWRKCECDLMSGPIKSRDMFDYRSFRLQRLFGAQTVEEAYEKWNDIVRLYSNRALTLETDRLPALSDVAKQFSYMMKACFDREERYLAGIWNDMPFSLMWRIENLNDGRDDKIHSRRPTEWRAPSWSWSSVEASVVYSPRSQLESRMALLEAVTKPKIPNDDFGRVVSGHIRIEAPLLERCVARSLGWRRRGVPLWALESQGIRIGDFSPDFEALDGEKPSNSFQCVALIVDYHNFTHTYGALIMRSATQDESAYVRIGIADLKEGRGANAPRITSPSVCGPTNLPNLDMPVGGWPNQILADAPVRAVTII